MIFFSILLSALCDAVVPQQAIIETMLNPTRFDKNVIPIQMGEILIVNITLNSFRLLSMDQKEETIQFQQEFLMTWHDSSLGWSRRNFSTYRFEWVKVGQKDIWVPDIIYYSTVENERIIDAKDGYADVKFDGTTRLSVPSTVTLPCSLQLDNFPYDEQSCDLLLGSWIFDQNQLQTMPAESTIKPDAANVSQRSSITYTGNSEWGLEEIQVHKYTMEIKTDGNYSLIRYRVKLSRKPVYYVMVIQIPTLLIATVTIFGIFTPFSQRMERWQKVELGLNMLLAISMMLNLVSEMMPKAERLPLLGNYIIAEIFICSVATVFSIVLLEVHARADQRKWRPPDCLCRWVLFSCGRRLRKGKLRAMEDPVATIPPRAAPFDTDVAADLLKLNAVRSQLKQTLHLVRSYMDRDRAEDEWRALWMRIFDRIDFLLLLLFQAANVGISVVFMR